VTDQILAIYDADFTVLGEIAYAIGKVTGTRQCSLCDISHGLNPFGKKNWHQYCETRPDIEWIHRNDLDSKTRTTLSSQLPCVVLKDSAGGYRTLLNDDELGACNGDVTQFDKKLSQALARHVAMSDGAHAS
jgi:hypothetical protein